MEYFKKITQKKLCELIESTQRALFISLPSIHEEVKNSMLKMKNDNKNAQVNILIDFDPQTFRQGYGEFDSVSDLIGNFDIKELRDNRISFVISDDIGYYLFIESRSIVPSDKDTLNAINIDPISLVRIKHFFFPSKANKDFQNEIANAIIEESRIIEKAEQEIIKASFSIPTLITPDRFNQVMEDIKSNPPLKPDFKRLVEYYSNKYQYSELHYEGQNIQNTTVPLPPKILPYRNEEIRKKMITKMKLFENLDQNPIFVQFRELEIRKKEISQKYLTPLKCRPNKSVLKKENKNYFLNAVNSVTADLEKSKNTLYSILLDEINTSKDNIKKSLFEFLIDNPTEDMIKLGKDNYIIIAEDISKTLIHKLHFPDPIKLIDNFKFKIYFSDLTYEDLSDKELINELIERNLFAENEKDSLADFGRGIKIE